MRSGAALALLAVACWACGDGGGDVDADTPTPDAAGAGSATLLLVGTCVANNLQNSNDPSDVRVDCEVRMSKDGAPVTTGQIRVNPAPPAIQTQLLPVETDPSLYRGFYSPYARTLRLSASAGSEDYLSETVVSGPEMHRIERPGPSETILAGQTLRVAWERPDTVAMSDVVLESGYEALGLAPDPGIHDVPGGEVQAGPDRAQVTRWRANPLGVGAAEGSILHFGVESATMFTVE